MTDPEKSPDELDQVVRGLSQEFGPRREHEPQPVYGEAHPLPPGSAPQRVRLSLPLSQPRAVWVLLALNIAIFAVPLLLDLLTGQPFSERVLEWGQKDNAAIYQNGEYYRLLSAMFLHAGLLHIGFNGWALYSLGRDAEGLYGTPRFLSVYFIAGLYGSLLSYALSPNPSVGASGAIFGLIGALAAFFYVAREPLGDLARQQLGSLITVAMINLFIGLSIPRIDNYAHIGGMLGGALAGWLLAPRLTVDTDLLPPALVRRSLPYAWAGVLGMLLILVAAVRLIVPAGL